MSVGREKEYLVAKTPCFQTHWIPAGADSRIVGMGNATYNFESMSNNADSHELLAVVAAVHHERVGQALNDRALGLAEALGGIATSGMGEVDGRANLNVIARCREPSQYVRCVEILFPCLPAQKLHASI